MQQCPAVEYTTGRKEGKYRSSRKLTDRNTYREADRQKATETNQADTETSIYAESRVGRKLACMLRAHREIERERDRDRQTDRQRHTHTNTAESAGKRQRETDRQRAGWVDGAHSAYRSSSAPGNRELMDCDIRLRRQSFSSLDSNQTTTTTTTNRMQGRRDSIAETQLISIAIIIKMTTVIAAAAAATTTTTTTTIIII